MEVSVHTGPESLERFAKECEESLLSAILYHFKYPTSASLTHWPVDEIKKENENFLGGLRNKGNVYALWVRKDDTDSWIPVYVGQRKSENLRERLTQHLISKNSKTGSMLEAIKTAVGAGEQIGVSFIKVNPESLRLYVEETIIGLRKSDLPWNTHG